MKTGATQKKSDNGTVAGNYTVGFDLGDGSTKGIGPTFPRPTGAQADLGGAAG
jgi:hypothetical protein